jgi:hypothetical protein
LSIIDILNNYPLKLSRMKKIICFFAGALLLSSALSSCKSGGSELDSDTNLEFSTSTVEQQKQSIEKNSMDLADKMIALQQTQAYVTLFQFNESSNKYFAPALVSCFRQLSASLIKNDVNALENFNKQVRIASNTGSNIWGTWTWNVKTQEFTRSSAIVLNKAVLIFPANDLNSTVNNAVLTLNYSESTVLIPEVDPAEFYPKSISATLKVDNTEVLNAQFEGSYASDGTPTSLTQTLVIGAYNWNASVTNKSTDVSANYTFKYNNDILLKYAVGAAGSFTATQIEAIVNDNTGDKSPVDIVKSGYMSFQIMNVAIYGGITDVKGFTTETDALSPELIVHQSDNSSYTEYFYGKPYRDKQVTIFNKYLKFYGYFASEKQKFADVEFYTAESQEQQPTLVATATTTGPFAPAVTVKYDYTTESYNYNTGVSTYNYYKYQTKTVYDVQPRLVLSDGSKITDFENYANSNFKTVITKFESMFN